MGTRESVRFKRTDSSPYYTVDGQYKYSEASNTAVETWHSYAGNLYDFDDRVNLSTHYLNVESVHWWWNPKRKKFDFRDSDATTCAGSGSYSIADTVLGSQW